MHQARGLAQQGPNWTAPPTITALDGRPPTIHGIYPFLTDVDADVLPTMYSVPPTFYRLPSTVYGGSPRGREEPPTVLLEEPSTIFLEEPPTTFLDEPPTAFLEEPPTTYLDETVVEMISGLQGGRPPTFPKWADPSLLVMGDNGLSTILPEAPPTVPVVPTRAVPAAPPPILTNWSFSHNLSSSNQGQKQIAFQRVTSHQTLMDITYCTSERHLEAAQVLPSTLTVHQKLALEMMRRASNWAALATRSLGNQALEVGSVAAKSAWKASGAMARITLDSAKSSWSRAKAVRPSKVNMETAVSNFMDNLHKLIPKVDNSECKTEEVRPHSVNLETAAYDIMDYLHKFIAQVEDGDSDTEEADNSPQQRTAFAPPAVAAQPPPPFPAAQNRADKMIGPQEVSRAAAIHPVPLRRGSLVCTAAPQHCYARQFRSSPAPHPPAAHRNPYAPMVKRQ